MKITSCEGEKLQGHFPKDLINHIWTQKQKEGNYMKGKAPTGEFAYKNSFGFMLINIIFNTVYLPQKIEA